jgi:hypothetical protein
MRTFSTSSLSLTVSPPEIDPHGSSESSRRTAGRLALGDVVNLRRPEGDLLADEH